MALNAAVNAAGVVDHSSGTISISATINGPAIIGVMIEDTGSVVVNSPSWSLGGTITPLFDLQVDGEAGDVKVRAYNLPNPTTGAGTLTIPLSGSPTTMGKGYIVDITGGDYTVGTPSFDTDAGSTHTATQRTATTAHTDDTVALHFVAWHATVGSFAGDNGQTVLLDGLTSGSNEEQVGLLERLFTADGSTLLNATWTNNRRYVSAVVPLDAVQGPGAPSIGALQESSDDTTFRATVTAGSSADSHTLHRSYTDPDFSPGAGNQVGGGLGASITAVEDTTVDPANTTAYYKLRATNESGSTDSAAKTYNIPPAVPTGLSLTAHVDHIQLDWTDQARAGSRVRVWRRTTGTFQKLEDLDSDVQTYDDWQAADGTVYTYALTGFIGDGNAEDEHSKESNHVSGQIATSTSFVPQVIVFL